MGIIAKQSFFNSITIALAFLIGAFNTVFLYPTYMGSEFQGLIVALLALSNLVQPFVSFGVQHALIKFYSTCKTKEERDRLLSLSITLPLIIFAIIILLSVTFQNEIIAFIASKNEAIGKYAFLIIAVAFSTAMFEVFYNWLRIQLHSVYGNFLKEFYPRALIFTLLLLYAFGGLDLSGFIYALIIGYYLRLVLVISYSLIKYTPKFSFKLPQQFKPIFRYSLLIFMSGTAASLILDIDKSMISNVLTVDNVAYYSVAVFIASVIEFPGRAMFQIISPLVAQALNNNDEERLLLLLNKSANNLLLGSGLLFLLINLNLIDFYQWVNLDGYAKALDVVLIISFGKLFSMSMGCLNNIITNSKYYQYVFWFSSASAILAVLLNLYFIQLYGIIGAAYATLIVIVVINLLKIMLVQIAFKMNPFGKKTILTLIAIFGLYGIFSNFSIDFSPLVTLLIRSLLIVIAFSFVTYFLRLTDDFQGFLTNHFTSRKKS